MQFMEYNEWGEGLTFCPPHGTEEGDFRLRETYSKKRAMIREEHHPPQVNYVKECSLGKNPLIWAVAAKAKFARGVAAENLRVRKRYSRITQKSNKAIKKVRK